MQTGDTAKPDGTGGTDRFKNRTADNASKPPKLGLFLKHNALNGTSGLNPPLNQGSLLLTEDSSLWSL